MKNNIVATDNRLKRSPSSVEKSGNPGVVDENEGKDLYELLSLDELLFCIGNCLDVVVKDIQSFDEETHNWLVLAIISLKLAHKNYHAKDRNETINYLITQIQYCNYKFVDMCKSKKFYNMPKVNLLKDVLDKYLVRLNHSINYPDNN